MGMRVWHMHAPGELQIPSQEIRLLWHSNYWDGPLSGMCRYRYERYWFALIGEEWDDPRKLGIFRLSAADLAYEDEVHRRFQAAVGTHTDYDAQGRRVDGIVRPQAAWEAFYTWYATQPKREYIDHEMIGWFAWP